MWPDVILRWNQNMFLVYLYTERDTFSSYSSIF